MEKFPSGFGKTDKSDKKLDLVIRKIGPIKAINFYESFNGKYFG